MKITQLRGDLAAFRNLELSIVLNAMKTENSRKPVTTLRQNILYLTPGIKSFAAEKIPVVLFGGELSGNLEQEEFEDRWIGEIPDHVVLVRNIDYSEPPRVEVYDVAMEEPVRYYPLDRFIDSWKDSKYYMISIK